MQPYSPEGLQAIPPSIDALHRGESTQEIFRAMCVKCDELHNLHVDLGLIRGIIPYEEATADILKGSQREYSIISRVGKPVCFQVKGFRQDGTAVLSRKAAMLDARSFCLNSLHPGDVLSACVVSTAHFGLFCDIGCGFTALMPIQRCCISRLQTTSDLFCSGQSICAAVLEVQEQLGRIVLTGRELLGTWEDNAEAFRQGQVVPGVVRSIMPYGIFVELTPNLSGLAEYMPGVAVGDWVSVFLRAILPEKHKIKMNILEKVSPPLSRKTPEYFITSGHISRWEYFPGSRAVTFF